MLQKEIYRNIFQKSINIVKESILDDNLREKLEDIASVYHFNDDIRLEGDTLYIYRLRPIAIDYVTAKIKNNKLSNIELRPNRFQPMTSRNTLRNEMNEVQAFMKELKNKFGI